MFKMKSFRSFLLGSIFAVSLFGSTADAAQINTIIDTGSGMFAEPEKVYQEIDKHVKSWFFPSEDEQKKLTLYERMHMDDSTRHTLVPTADSDAIVQIYREEKVAAISSDMEIAGVQQRDIVLTQDDFAKLSEQLGADYIIYFRVTSSMPTISVGFFSSGQKTNVTTDFRIWDKTTGKYVFAKRYQTTGSSSSVLSYGFGASANAVKDGLNKALEQIDKDKATIVSCVK